jgi:CRP-like cAMP-binding protein
MERRYLARRCRRMPISRIDTFLRKLERRDRLSSAEAELLVDAAGDDVSFDMDSDLVREGDRPATSTLLVSGLATRYRVLSDGQRQITAIHVPGDFVDLHSLLLREMDHSVAALTRCRIVRYPHERLKRITEQAPHLTRLLWLMTLIDASIQREWIVAMGRRSAGQQMVHLLCELYVRLGVAGLVDGPSFSFPITQVQLGDALGMSAVHVNRVLQELRGENLFTWQGQTVRILDWEGLQQRAEFDPRYLHLNIESR